MTEYLFHLTQGRGIEQQTTDTDHKYLYDDTSQYLPKKQSSICVFCFKSTVLSKHLHRKAWAKCAHAQIHRRQS